MKKQLLLPLALFFLTACGSDDAFYGDSTNTPSGDTTTSTGGGDNTTGPVIRIGSGSGNSFVTGTLDIGLSSLPAGASTGITVDLVDEAGNLYTTPTSVVFNSECEKTGLAELTSPAMTFAGRATSNYVAKGCEGNDTIIATAVVNDTTLQATGSINVIKAKLGSIQFISATPTNIALKGTGGAGLEETSTVIFKVLNEVGGPVANEEITFSLNTTIGGLTLTPETGTTNSQGEVQTVVQSGTVATAIRITATVTNSSPQLKTQSDRLTITTGLPDQNSFSLSASIFNSEAWNHDGETVSITARLADRFNNPAPDGTAVAFTAEGGSIEGSCLTTGGACSVNWSSQNVRPCGQIIGNNSIAGADVNATLNNCIESGANNAGPQAGFAPLGQPYGGRVTITATAVGEESFTDRNGNFVFDDGEEFTDLTEAFLDTNENGVFDLGQDIFYDFNENNQYDTGDNRFNGVLCSHSTLCSARQTLHIRDSLALVMSGSSAYLSINPSSLTISNGGSASTLVHLSDLHHQMMPVGTTIKIETTAGTLVSSGSFTIANTNYNGGFTFPISIKGKGEDEGDSGIATITTTTPKGIESSLAIAVTEVAKSITIDPGTNLPPEKLGSVQFISATPASIALKGTGGAGLTETSIITFKVLDDVGGPVADQEVSFSLNTTIGGLALTPETGTTDSQGMVQTVVQSGTVATSIRITATVTSATPPLELKTQSDQLTITTGLPDQNSFSLSASTFNPEAWSRDGETVSITARLADRFNNPAPDGTAITFTTEGGSIEGSCLTMGGACSVTWTSQNVRPCGQTIGADSIIGADVNVTLNNCIESGASNTGPQAGFAPLGQPYGGRATITATAVGEESFADRNGNFVFDDGEEFTDLAEAFLDTNENNAFDLGQDIFFDFNEDGQYNTADGEFNGVLCSHSTLCSAKQTLHVRDSLVLVMSGSGAYLSANPSSIIIPNGGFGSTTVQLSDLHNQPMPAGTTIKVETTAGTLVSSGSFLINNTSFNGGTGFGISIEGGGEDDGDSGVAIITVTTPKGVESSLALSVTEAAKPSADLSINMAGPATAVLNALEPYVVTITNNGPDTAIGTILTITLANSATFDSFTTIPAGSNCFGSPLVCSLGDIASGGSATVTVNATLTAAEVIINESSVISTVRDLNPGNNEGGLNTVVN